MAALLDAGRIDDARRAAEDAATRDELARELWPRRRRRSIGPSPAVIVWAEGKRREKMRLAFIGEGAGCSPEAGLVMPDAGESELAALERTLSGMAFPDEVAVLDERVRPAFRWVVRSRKFDRNGEVWEGEVVAVHDPDAEPRPFSSRDAWPSFCV